MRFKKDKKLKMKKTSKLLILLIIISTLSMLCTADDSATTYNLELGTVMCIDNTEIRMNEEFVQLFDDGFTITNFYFENTSSETIKIQFGFPIVGEPSMYKKNRFHDSEKKSEDEERKIIEDVFKFKTVIDDKPIKRELVKADQTTIDQFGYFGGDYSEYQEISYFYICELTFKPYEKHKVVNYYYQPKSKGSDSIGESWTTLLYILRTGSTWKDSIGKCVVEYYDQTCYDYITQDNILTGPYQSFSTYNFHVSSYSIGFSKLSPTTIYKNGKTTVYRWEYLNYEPDQDISITYFSTPSYYGSQADITINTFAYLALLIDSGIYSNLDYKSMKKYFINGVNSVLSPFNDSYQEDRVIIEETQKNSNNFLEIIKALYKDNSDYNDF